MKRELSLIPYKEFEDFFDNSCRAEHFQIPEGNLDDTIKLLNKINKRLKARGWNKIQMDRFYENNYDAFFYNEFYGIKDEKRT